MTGEALVRVHRHGEGGVVAEVVLDRPSALNAVSTALARDLTSACEKVAADGTVRAVVLSSSGTKAFCVGADLKERAGLSDEELAHQRPVTRAAYAAVLSLPMPAVAAVEGYALGGGLEIALGCDLVVAARSAVVGLPEVTVGVIPGGGGTQLLTRRIGWSRAASMIFTGRRLAAADALALGVVDEVVPDGTARQRALAVAEEVASNSPVAVRQAKRAMRRGVHLELAAGLEVEDACWRATAFSADRVEGVLAFVQRRAPQWPAT
ncbi:MAG TPA: enoyl-CoA hydratase-related protein [Dermatophilaceae bacterium]|nr:enoyl-CoA hydratase-related protein [Dermatophilaceae bacterium]